VACNSPIFTLLLCQARSRCGRWLPYAHGLTCQPVQVARDAGGRHLCGVRDKGADKAAMTRPLVPSLGEILGSAGGPQITCEMAALAAACRLQQAAGGGSSSGAGSAAVGEDGASEGTVDNGAEPTLSSAMWSYPGPDSFKLRGRNYLRDKKKVRCVQVSCICPALASVVCWLDALVHDPLQGLGTVLVHLPHVI
jgi:hypothetical protein